MIATQEIASYAVHFRPHTGKARHLTCMDDRSYTDAILNEGLQIAGGVYGIAADLVAAGEATVWDSHLSTARKTAETQQPRPVDVWAKIVGKTLTRHGIFGTLHKGCAAEEGMLAIIDAAVQASDDPEKLGKIAANSRLLHPGITDTAVQLSVDAFARMRNADLFREPEVAAGSMEGDTPDLPKLQRYALREEKHASGVVIANYRRDEWFDTQQALEGGNPAYHINLGDLPRIQEATGAVLPVGHEQLLAATAVRHALTIPNLPHPNDQNPGGFAILLAA